MISFFCPPLLAAKKQTEPGRLQRTPPSCIRPFGRLRGTPSFSLRRSLRSSTRKPVRWRTTRQLFTRTSRRTQTSEWDVKLKRRSTQTLCRNIKIAKTTGQMWLGTGLLSSTLALTSLANSRKTICGQSK